MRGALQMTEDRLGESEAERDAMVAALAQKDKELSAMTAALQKAILEQKGVAETAQKWKKAH